MKRDELFQIGEVSRLFHISVSTLRYYDRLGIVCPEYTDPNSGYRYYSSRQFECLNTIRYLRALDMPMEQICSFLQNREIGKIQEMLQKQQQEVKKKQQELYLIERKISNRLAQIEDALASELNVIKIVEKPERRIASIRRKLLPQDDHGLEYSIRLLEEAEEGTVTFLGKVGVGISRARLIEKQYESYDSVFLLLDEEDYFKGDITVIPPETCAVIRFQGRHDQAPDYYKSLGNYIDENQYQIAGFSKEITMIDFGLTNDTTKFVTEIQIPVKNG